jgi:hypothetical protein
LLGWFEFNRDFLKDKNFNVNCLINLTLAFIVPKKQKKKKVAWELHYKVGSQEKVGEQCA